jgi:hypothetical protein
MTDDKPLDRLVYELKERAKELNCLYNVQELLNNPETTFDQKCAQLVREIPAGWQYPDVCEAVITLGDRIYRSAEFSETPWNQRSVIQVQDDVIGEIYIYYTEERPPEDEGPFLKEERKLIDTIAEQIGLHILHNRLRKVFREQETFEDEKKSEWWVVLDLLRRTDPKLLIRISRKMIIYLYLKDVKEAAGLLNQFVPTLSETYQYNGETNRPYPAQATELSDRVIEEVFITANKYLSEEEILANIQNWIKEDRSGFLVDILVNPGSSLEAIISAIERYHHLVSQGLELSNSREKWFRVSLIRRILNDQPDYIEIAKKYIRVDDFSDFIQHIIYPVSSHGKLGGKSSGLFLAEQIIKNTSQDNELLQDVRTPKTWYLTSDGIFYFMRYNNLEDIVEQKYRTVEQVRQEYAYIINLFKSSPLPPEIIKGLSIALDDFGDVPLIVRSSSLLEDRSGASFAGKYKSLYIANQGSKEERLSALTDAITEVYASMFGPDPLDYRSKQGLLDYHEEMGIMIQEVVGNRIGDYYFPSYAGVAFSSNEFPWSSRIKRSDGLARLVPGLGTRAVDRVDNDYPIMVAPGQPGLRVNVTADEIIRYSPKMIDLINLKTGRFEQHEIGTLLKEVGHKYPIIHRLVSIVNHDQVQEPRIRKLNFSNGSFVVTFDGLFARTNFLDQLRSILDLLSTTFGRPVDIEFAHDGDHFYLLQCRAQSFGEDHQPPSIPGNIDSREILFTAERYITNGQISGISHVVYVDPIKYSSTSNLQELKAIGQVIGKLNKILPRRNFILMGPGRWGSRGDIKLGVNVTYSDINNTAMLIEIARLNENFAPDPSFGTHFFQDLVESQIRYLPLYPDDEQIIFLSLIHI